MDGGCGGYENGRMGRAPEISYGGGKGVKKHIEETRFVDGVNEQYKIKLSLSG